MSRPWFIYTLHDPREPGVVRYVGKTWNTVTRLTRHVKDAQRDKDNSYCGNWKRALLKEGVIPVLTVIEIGSGPTWGAAEKRWVSHFRSVVGDKLTNYTDGGEGFQGQHRDETKLKMSRASLGKRKTPEHAANIAAGRKGWVPSDETRQRMREAQLGKVQPPEQSAKISASLKKTLANNPEQRAIRSRAAKGYASRPEERETRRERLRAIWADPERRAARIEAMKIAANARFHPT